MGKRHPNLPAWQWRSNPQSHQGSTHQAINLIAIPIMVVAFLLLVSGVFSENATSAVIGLVALFAALILQHQGRTQENSQTF
ncbi:MULTISPECIES: terminase [unclassified Pseudomonas]|jgi:hypothetical protein|uniref:terminase n=1 Tax=unclassified Pseudomonas TaxID=196821 RepID=UPI001C5A5D93|nr:MULTISPECIES: terminase [unclassified Pseudomonas]MBW3504117.1 terminase [Pseudomonas sp. NKUCC02_KPG]MEC4238631.1 terminase [Pseudomonas sp. DSV-1]